jgi:bifunctional non-homologous end joining protein LigD
MEVVKGQKMKSVDFASTQLVVDLCEDTNWVAEQKFDGTRAMVTWEPGEGFTLRHIGGGPLKHTAATQWKGELFASLPQAPYSYQVDGELLIEDGTYIVYDVLLMDEDELWQRPFHVRRSHLEMLALGFRGRVRKAQQATSHLEKVALVKRAEAEFFEGVVFKHVDGIYEPGKRVESQLKLKFFREADLVISERDVNGGCNARYFVFNDEGERVDMGGCSMIGKPDAQPGDVVEVRYLYMAAGGSLYTPTLVRIRTDKAPEECLHSQFNFVNRGVMA